MHTSPIHLECPYRFALLQYPPSKIPQASADVCRQIVQRYAKDDDFLIGKSKVEPSYPFLRPFISFSNNRIQYCC